MMLRHRDLIDRLEFPKLESLMVGSAPVTRELADQIEDAFRRSGLRRATA